MSNGCAVSGFGSSAARAPAAGVAAFEAVFGFSEGLRASGFAAGSALDESVVAAVVFEVSFGFSEGLPASGLAAGSVSSAVSPFPGPLPLCAAGGGAGVAVDFAASVWDAAGDPGRAADGVTGG